MEVVIFVSFLIFLVICIYLIVKRKTYTRERFAFFSTLLVASFVGGVFTHIVADKSLIGIFVSLFNMLPYEDIPVQDTSWSDKLWSIFILLMFMLFVYALYDGWWDGGAVSKKDYDAKRKKKPLKFVQAAIAGASFKSLQKVDENQVRSSSVTDSYELYHLDETLDWHSEVKSLLLMSSRQYEISSSDWHSEKKAYLSQFSGKPILILCCLKNPELESVKEVIDYFNSYQQKKVLHVLVAIKQSYGTIEKFEYDGCSIQCKCKDEMLDSLVDFSEYFDYLRSQFYETQITEGDGVTLQDIYVESSAEIVDLKEGEEKKFVENVGSYLLDWMKDDVRGRHISLLGEYGQGKSVLSLKFALDVIAQEGSRIPIIIELRGKSPRNETVATIIASWALRFDINVNAIQRLLQEGRLLIILEGFDELDMVGDSFRRLEHFKRLWEFARYKKSKVIITGRPNLFLDNVEARQYLHLDNDSANLFQVEAVNLRPFIRSQVESALRHAKDNVKSEILSLFDSEMGSFRDLVSRPSTLYQTSVIWDVIDKKNINSASVIDEFINHAYRRQAGKLLSLGPTGVESPVLTAKEREYFMLGVAVGMVQRGGYSNQISLSDLYSIVASLYFEVPRCVSIDHSEGVGLHRRLSGDPNEISSVFNDVRTAGVLVRDLSGSDSFKFAHKSFLELLFAKYVVGLLSGGENEVVFNSVSKALDIGGNVFNLKYSSEVVSHISDLLVFNGGEGNDKEVADRLMYKIHPSLKWIDKIFFRRFLGLAAIDTVLIVILIISVGVFSYLEGITLLSSIAPAIAAISASLLIAAFFRKTLFSRSGASYRVWRSLCEKRGIDICKCDVLGKDFRAYSKGDKGGVDMAYDGYWKMIALTNEVVERTVLGKRARRESDSGSDV